MSKFTIGVLIKEAAEAHKVGDYIKEKNSYQELYDLFKRELGEKHSNTLSALNNLANSYSCLGDYNKACELQNTVYNVSKEILGERHIDTLISLHNLACSYSNC